MNLILAMSQTGLLGIVVLGLLVLLLGIVYFNKLKKAKEDELKEKAIVNVGTSVHSQGKFDIGKYIPPAIPLDVVKKESEKSGVMKDSELPKVIKKPIAVIKEGAVKEVSKDAPVPSDSNKIKYVNPNKYMRITNKEICEYTKAGNINQLSAKQMKDTIQYIATKNRTNGLSPYSVYFTCTLTELSQAMDLSSSGQMLSMYFLGKQVSKNAKATIEKYLKENKTGAMLDVKLSK